MKFYKESYVNVLGYTIINYRVVEQLAGNRFVVVKLMASGAKTIKFWHGDLSITESHWNTEIFMPDKRLRFRLITEFWRTVREFSPDLLEVLHEFARCMRITQSCSSKLPGQGRKGKSNRSKNNLC